MKPGEPGEPCFRKGRDPRPGIVKALSDLKVYMNLRALFEKQGSRGEIRRLRGSEDSNRQSRCAKLAMR